MKIERLKVKNFRNYTEAVIEPHPGINLFFGMNGSGKTNLLEAVHYCALGRSHRTSQDQEVVRRGEEAALAQVRLESHALHHDIDVLLTPKEARKKQISIDGKRASRLSDLMGKLRCVIFSPEDLNMIRGGPSLRRKFLDMMISQLSEEYFVALQQYQRSLAQRNAILKDRMMPQSRQRAMLDAFEEQMAGPALMICRKRTDIMNGFFPIIEECYRSISGRENEKLRLRYQCAIKDAMDERDKLIALWRDSRQDDRERGQTAIGPHRDELRFSLNDHDMRLYASQGQVRTASLCMKLAQMRYFEQVTGDSPILLLDDVMSELDMTRRQQLLDEINGEQTWITCTDQTDLNYYKQCRVYEVKLTEKMDGSIRQVQQGEEIEKAVTEDHVFE